MDEHDTIILVKLKIDKDIIDVLTGRGPMVSAYVANCLRSSPEYKGNISTARVLRRLKTLEKTGLVCRGKTSYVSMIAFRLVLGVGAGNRRFAISAPGFPEKIISDQNVSWATEAYLKSLPEGHCVQWPSIKRRLLGYEFKIRNLEKSNAAA